MTFAGSILREKRYMVGGALLAALSVILLLSWSGSEATSFIASTAAAGIRHSIGAKDGLESVLGPVTVGEEEGFTIVAPTYKRVESLPRWISSYANNNITGLRGIVLIWTDTETQPPESFLRTLDSYPIPVTVEVQDVNSLNRRFRRSKSIKTNCVLSLDDDMIFDPEDVEFAYNVWKTYGEGRKKMVGYIAREMKKKGDKYVYEYSEVKTYSMVLTKCAFLHVDWLDKYWSNDKTITGLRNYVDEHRNCEDILMSYLHAHYTQVPPIFIKAPKIDIGTNRGVSAKGGHLDARAACLQHFSEALGEDTLPSSSMKIENLLSPKEVVAE